MRFEWDPDKAVTNLKRHRVSFEEAIEALFDPNAVDDFDPDHSSDETRFNLIGLSSRRLLFVVYNATSRQCNPHYFGTQSGEEASENL